MCTFIGSPGSPSTDTSYFVARWATQTSSRNALSASIAATASTGAS